MKKEQEKTKDDTDQILENDEEYREAYGDGFPQDENSQGAERIKLRDISRPFDPGFQNEGHIPLTITHSGGPLE